MMLLDFCRCCCHSSQKVFAFSNIYQSLDGNCINHHYRQNKLVILLPIIIIFQDANNTLFLEVGE